jgi:hypothetical protein
MEMDDGVRFRGSFAEQTEFIDLPEGYSVDQIVSIGPQTRSDVRTLNNHSVFDCFLEGL